MRICMVTTSYPRWRGDLAGHFVEGLARHLVDEQGIGVTVLAPAAKGAPARECDGGLAVRRLRYFWPAGWQRLAYGDGMPANLRASRLARLNAPFLMAAFALRMCGLRGKCDVVHGHWGVLGALAIATRPIHRRPVVLTTHGSDLNSTCGLIRRITRWALARADAATSNCQASHQACLALRGDPKPTYRLPNGIPWPTDEEVRRRRAQAAQAAGPRIVSVGRLIPQRRHELLVRAFASIRGRFGGSSLTIIGEGPAMGPLRQLGEALRLGDSLRLPGRVPPSDVENYLYAADLYVSPTTVETFGMAVAEAAARALPVVTTGVGFPAEMVLDGETGYIVEPDDEWALAAAMANVLALGAEGRRAMGRRMRARADELGLTESGWAAAFARIYRSIAPESQG